MDDHLVEVPGTDWRVWRWALLRSAGFPADGLDRFTAAECAEAADRRLAGSADDFDAAFERAVEATARAVHDIAGDPRFRTAVTWQNPGAAVAADSVLRDGPLATRNSRRRSREEIIAKYWQRYCAKNDTVGFFGPMCWVTLEPGTAPLTGGPGPALTRGTLIFFERWALAAIADRLAEDPRIRPWLPAGLQPQLTVTGRSLHSPLRPAVTLSRAEAALLALCDGVRNAHETAQLLISDPESPFHAESDVYTLLYQFATRGVIRWIADLPMNLEAESVLRRHLAGIGDEEARQWATAAFDRLCALRDVLPTITVPGELGAAIAALDAEFTTFTGQEPRQRSGQTQAGRTLCHIEAVRDLELTFGDALLDKLTALEPLLVSARWLSAALAEAYEAYLTESYQEAAAELGSPQVPFAQLWFPALDAFVGKERPADSVIEEYLERWTDILGLDEQACQAARLDVDRRDLLARARQAFPADRPGWSSARFHSPDLHICAPSPEAVERGEFTVALGELHVSLAAFDTHFFMLGHPEPTLLVDAMSRDLPMSRVGIAIPDDWPRTTAREAEWLTGPTDVQLGFTPAPAVDRERLLPITSLTVSPGAGSLVVRAPDGRSWPLIEMFAGLLWMHAFDTWKLAGTSAHTPRIAVDGVVLVRETWRTTVGATGLADVTGERERYLAVRRWRRDLGLPERVFMRIGTETKPCYFDLSSPLYARILCNMMGAALRSGGAETSLAVSEMLPGPEQSWLPDAEGRYYTSELRIQLRDSAQAVS